MILEEKMELTKKLEMKEKIKLEEKMEIKENMDTEVYMKIDDNVEEKEKSNQQEKSKMNVKIEMKAYGWLEDQYQCVGMPMAQFLPARVSEVHRERYQVICENGEVSARLKGTFYKELGDINMVPVVGDYVQLKYNPSGDSLIGGIYERKSMFSRADNSGHAAGYMKTLKEQVVAANFDYVFIVASLNQNFNLNRIERYYAIALQSGAIPVVILTKADINPRYQEYVDQVKAFSEQVRVHAISSITGLGMSELKPYFKEGKTIVFLGSSGVGKSTLVNAIAGEEVMKVSEIREEDARGRHTTTHRQLLMLPSKTMVIDTPGMREIGIYEASEGLDITFADINELIGTCRFSNCTHKSEPGCAVLAALESGELSMERWENYRKLMDEAVWAHKKSSSIRLKKLQSRTAARR